MSSNQKTTVIVVGMILVAVIVGVAIKKPSADSQVLSQNTGSTDDHHKPKPVDSAVFDSLLGQQAPDFTLTSFDDKQISLKDFRGQNVLLFFNEGLMCYPACWNQIVAFGKDNAFMSNNTVVLNINVDSKEDWKKAIDKMPELSANTVLLDTNRDVSNLY
ncbi:MAG: redoxin domain-containing protein, partial [Patescibacteria group bacterium]